MAGIDTICKRCHGAKKVTVGRELSHDLERCGRCQGSGEEPERFLRQQRVLTIVEELNGKLGNEERIRSIQYSWEGFTEETLRISVNKDDLFNFWTLVKRVIGDYQPRLETVIDYGDGEIRIELVFNPHD